MDSQNEQARQESRDPDQPRHDVTRSSRQPGRGQRQNQSRDQGSRASGGAPRSSPNESGGGGGNRGKNRGGSSAHQQEGRDGRRRRKEGGDRRGIYGFGDAVERCTCAAYHHEMPDTWPVHSRSNLATLRVIEVDRRPSAILFCDGAHTGPHIWPDGEIVATSLPAHSEETETPPGAESTDDTVESNS